MQIAIIDSHDLTREALEKATVTTWEEFLDQNRDAFSRSEATDIAMAILDGKPHRLGGGAEAEYTLISEVDRPKFLAQAERR